MLGGVMPIQSEERDRAPEATARVQVRATMPAGRVAFLMMCLDACWADVEEFNVMPFEPSITTSPDVPATTDRRPSATG